MKNNKESDTANDQKRISDFASKEKCRVGNESKQLSYEIDRNNSEVMSWEKTKAPGSARDSNSSASVRLSLNGLQLEDQWLKQLDSTF